MCEELRIALFEYSKTIGMKTSTFLIESERSKGMSPQAVVNLFQRWYRHLGFMGCSSHSGRRTFITNAARRISTVGGSLRDVQVLAGHSSIRTTERYIDPNCGSAWLWTPNRRRRLALTQLWCSFYSAPINLA
jgi:integrase/recombinase XerD